jgi:hypothetical protein
MPDPISFTSASARYGLPLLFAGQAQKEFFVNQAHALTDALLHPAIEGEVDDPPAAPQEGETWLIGTTPSGAGDGRAGWLACFQAGAWVFAEPRDGLRVLDRVTGRTSAIEGAGSARSRPKPQRAARQWTPKRARRSPRWLRH